MSFNNADLVSWTLRVGVTLRSHLAGHKKHHQHALHHRGGLSNVAAFSFHIHAFSIDSIFAKHKVLLPTFSFTVIRG